MARITGMPRVAMAAIMAMVMLFMAGPVQAAYKFDVSPQVGPYVGGTKVTVTTTYSVPSDTKYLYCMFGDHSVIADSYYVKNGEAALECTTPKGTALNVVDVKVSFDGISYVNTGTGFWYHEKLSIDQLHGALSETKGGQPVEVSLRGDLFNPGITTKEVSPTCMFDTVVVAGTFYPVKMGAPAYVACTAPPMAEAGVVDVKVSLDGQAYSHNKAAFTYLFSVFGDESEGDSTIKIVSDPLQVEQDPDNTILMDPNKIPDLGFYEFYGKAPHVVDPEIPLSKLCMIALTPALGPASGGTAVSVKMAGVVPEGQTAFYCSFGGEVVMADSFFFSTDGGAPTIVCTTPPGYAMTSVPLRVGLDGQNFTAAAATFYYHDELVPNMLMPSAASTVGGANILIELEEDPLQDDFDVDMVTVPAACKFDDVQVPGEYMVSKSGAHPPRLICQTPKMDVGVVALTISLNEQQFSTAAATFTFLYGLPEETSFAAPEGPTALDAGFYEFYHFYTTFYNFFYFYDFYGGVEEPMPELPSTNYNPTPAPTIFDYLPFSPDYCVFFDSGPDTTIEQLELSEGDFSLPFNPRTLVYFASVPKAVDCTSIFAVSSDPLSQMTVNGRDLESGEYSKCLSLSIGENLFEITVVGQDGVSSQVYSIVVVRLASTDATLSDITITDDDGTTLALVPTFSPTTLSYTLSTTESTLYFYFTGGDPDSTISVNGVDVDHGVAVAVSLANGANTIEIQVLAEDGISIITYTIIITRGEDLTFSALSVYGMVYHSGNEGAVVSDDLIDYATATTSYTPTSDDDWDNKYNVAKITLTLGSTTDVLSYTYTAEDRTAVSFSGTSLNTTGFNSTGYVNSTGYYAGFTGRRLLSDGSEADVGSDGLVPATGGRHLLSHELGSCYSTTSPSGVVTSNVTSATTTTSTTLYFCLPTGTSVVTLTINNAAGTSSSSYVLTFARKSINTELAQLQVNTTSSDNTYLANANNVSIGNSSGYSFNFASTVSSYQIIPVPADLHSTVYVNFFNVTSAAWVTQTVASGSASSEIPLFMCGENDAYIVVTAEDTSYSKTFSVAAIRLGDSRHSKLRYITLENSTAAYGSGSKIFYGSGCTSAGTEVTMPLTSSNTCTDFDVRVLRSWSGGNYETAGSTDIFVTFSSFWFTRYSSTNTNNATTAFSLAATATNGNYFSHTGEVSVADSAGTVSTQAFRCLLDSWWSNSTNSTITSPLTSFSCIDNDPAVNMFGGISSSYTSGNLLTARKLTTLVTACDSLQQTTYTINIGRVDGEAGLATLLYDGTSVSSFSTSTYRYTVSQGYTTAANLVNFTLSRVDTSVAYVASTTDSSLICGTNMTTTTALSNGTLWFFSTPTPGTTQYIYICTTGAFGSVGTYRITISTTDTPSPTPAPTPAPTVATPAPTPAPTTLSPTPAPTVAPTPAPTVAPTPGPTVAPTVAPTPAPTVAPTVAPTPAPTVAPTVAPTPAPTPAPVLITTAAPTVAPTPAPTVASIVYNTALQTLAVTTDGTIQQAISPAFSPTILSYTMQVSRNSTTAFIEANLADTTMSLYVGASLVTRRQLTTTLALNVYSVNQFTSVSIGVYSPGCTPSSCTTGSRTLYTVTIEMLGDTASAISEFRIASGAEADANAQVLPAIYGTSNLTYLYDAPSTWAEVKILLSLGATSAATATIGGVAASATTAAGVVKSGNLAIVSGPNEFSAVVTAEDGVTTSTYQLVVYKNLVPPAPLRLASLGEPSTLVPAWNPLQHGFQLFVAAGSTVSFQPVAVGGVQTRVLASTCANGLATTQYNGLGVCGGSIPIASGTTAVVVQVGSGSAITYYRVFVHNDETRLNVDGSKLTSISGAALSPAFNTNLTAYWSSSTANSLSWSAAGMSEVLIGDNTAGGSKTLDYTFDTAWTRVRGRNSVNNAVLDYMVQIDRLGSALLTNFSGVGVTGTVYNFAQGTGGGCAGNSVVFDAQCFDYTLLVPNTVTTVTVVAARSDIDTTVSITVSGAVRNTVNQDVLAIPDLAVTVPPIGSQVPVCYTITGNAGPGTLTGVSTNTYCVTITRASAADARLTDLVMEASVPTGTPATYPLSPSFFQDVLSYTVSLPKNATTVYLTATAFDPAAQGISVNGQFALVDQTRSDPIDLLTLFGATYKSGNLTVVVTSSDGSATQTYAIAITRIPSDNSLLGAVTISGVQAAFTQALYSTTGAAVAFNSGTLQYTVGDAVGPEIDNAIVNLDVAGIPAEVDATMEVIDLGEQGVTTGTAVAMNETTPAPVGPVYVYEPEEADCLTLPVTQTCDSLAGLQAVHQFQIVVTAENGISITTYDFAVSRRPGSVGTLQDLMVISPMTTIFQTADNARSNTGFVGTQFLFHVYLPYALTSVTVDAVATANQRAPLAPGGTYMTITGPAALQPGGGFTPEAVPGFNNLTQVIGGTATWSQIKVGQNEVVITTVPQDRQSANGAIYGLNISRMGQPVQASEFYPSMDFASFSTDSAYQDAWKEAKAAVLAVQPYQIDILSVTAGSLTIVYQVHPVILATRAALTDPASVPSVDSLPDPTNTTQFPDPTSLPDPTNTTLFPDPTSLPDPTNTTLFPDPSTLPDPTDTNLFTNPEDLPDPAALADPTTLPDPGPLEAEAEALAAAVPPSPIAEQSVEQTMGLAGIEPAPPAVEASVSLTGLPEPPVVPPGTPPGTPEEPNPLTDYTDPIDPAVLDSIVAGVVDGLSTSASSSSLAGVTAENIVVKDVTYNLDTGAYDVVYDIEVPITVAPGDPPPTAAELASFASEATAASSDTSSAVAAAVTAADPTITPVATVADAAPAAPQPSASQQAEILEGIVDTFSSIDGMEGLTVEDVVDTATFTYNEATGEFDVTYDVPVPEPVQAVASSMDIGGLPPPPVGQTTPDAATVTDLKLALVDSYSTLEGMEDVSVDEVKIKSAIYDATTGTWAIDYSVTIPEPAPAVSQSVGITTPDIQANPDGSAPPEAEDLFVLSILNGLTSIGSGTGSGSGGPTSAPQPAPTPSVSTDTTTVTATPAPPAVESSVSMTGLPAPPTVPADAVPGTPEAPNPLTDYSSPIEPATLDSIVAGVVSGLAGSASSPSLAGVTATDIVVKDVVYDEATGAYDVVYDIVVPATGGATPTAAELQAFADEASAAAVDTSDAVIASVSDTVGGAAPAPPPAVTVDSTAVVAEQAPASVESSVALSGLPAPPTVPADAVPGTPEAPNPLTDYSSPIEPATLDSIVAGVVSGLSGSTSSPTFAGVTAADIVVKDVVYDEATGTYDVVYDIAVPATGGVPLTPAELTAATAEASAAATDTQTAVVSTVTAAVPAATPVATVAPATEAAVQPTQAAKATIETDLLATVQAQAGFEGVAAEDIVVTGYTFNEATQEFDVQYEVTVDPPPSPPSAIGAAVAPAGPAPVEPAASEQAAIEADLLATVQAQAGFEGVAAEDIVITGYTYNEATQEFDVQYEVTVVAPPAPPAVTPPAAGVSPFAGLDPEDISITSAVFNTVTGTWDIEYEVELPDPPSYISSEMRIGGADSIPAGAAGEVVVKDGLVASLQGIDGLEGIVADDIRIISTETDPVTGELIVDYEIKADQPPKEISQDVLITGQGIPTAAAVGDLPALAVTAIKAGVATAFEKRGIFTSNNITADEVTIKSAVTTAAGLKIVYSAAFPTPAPGLLADKMDDVSARLKLNNFAVGSNIRQALLPSYPSATVTAETVKPGLTSPPSASTVAASIESNAAEVASSFSAAVPGTTAQPPTAQGQKSVAPSAAAAAIALSSATDAVAAGVESTVPGATATVQPAAAAVANATTSPAELAVASNGAGAAIANAVADQIPSASATANTASAASTTPPSAADIAVAANAKSSELAANVAASSGATATVLPSAANPVAVEAAHVEVEQTLENLGEPQADGTLPANAQANVKSGVAAGASGSIPGLTANDIEITSQTYTPPGNSGRRLLQSGSWTVVTKINIPVNPETGNPVVTPTEASTAVDPAAVSASVASATGATVVSVPSVTVPAQPDPPLADVSKMITEADLPSPTEVGLTAAEVAARQQRIDDLNAARSAAAAATEALFAEYQAAQTAADNAANAADLAAANRGAAAFAIAEATSSRDAATQDIAVAQAVRDSAQADIDAAAQARADAQAAIDAATQARADAQAAIDQATADRAALQAQIDAANAAAEAAAAEEAAINQATLDGAARLAQSITNTADAPLPLACPLTATSCRSNPKGTLGSVSLPPIPSTTCPACSIGFLTTQVPVGTSATGAQEFTCGCQAIPTDNDLEDGEIAGIVIVSGIALSVAGAVGYSVYKKSSAASTVAREVIAAERALGPQPTKTELNPSWQSTAPLDGPAYGMGKAAGGAAGAGKAAAAAAPAAAPSSAPVSSFPIGMGSSAPAAAPAPSAQAPSAPIPSSSAPTPSSAPSASAPASAGTSAAAASRVMQPEPPVDVGMVDVGMPMQRPQMPQSSAAADTQVLTSVTQEMEASQLPTTQAAETPVTSSAFEFLGKKK